MSEENLNPSADTQVEEPNYLDMSDEDIQNLDFNHLNTQAQTEVSSEETDEEVEEQVGATEEEVGEGSEDTDQVAEENPETTESEESTEQTEQELDYKGELAKLLAPFTANGKEMKVDNVDEAIQLMQMGAGYNKKMAKLKPHLKTLKLLEKNDLLSEDKLGFLIDLSRKKPEAIAKLMQDGGIDPMDMNTELANEYKPETYTVDDRELALDETLENLRDTPTFTKVLSLVSNKWDGASKQVVAENPTLLEVLNDHMANGVYDVISKEMEKQQLLGRYKGMSDIQVYKAIGDSIEARGGFNHLFQKQPSVKDVVEQVKKPAVNPAQINDRKKAVSPIKQSRPASEPNFNPLSMSDEEFEKVGLTKFLR